MKLLTCFAVVVVLCGGVSIAPAQVYVNDNFDGYADQAAFQAVWTPIGCSAGCTTNQFKSVLLSTDTSVSAPNSLLSEDIDVVGNNDNAERNRFVFAATTAAKTPVLVPGMQLEFSFDFYDANPTASPYRQYANMQDTITPGGTNQLVSMGLNNNQLASASGGNYYMARVLGYSNPIVDPDGGPNEALAGTNFIKLNDYATSPLRTEGWHNLKVLISTDSTAPADGYDYKFYVDDILAETVSNVANAFDARRRYDNVTVGSGVTAPSGDYAYFDNFFVELTTPPTSTADFNGDGTIDAADYVVWRKNYGLFGSATQADGDANEDNTVDDLDYDIWVSTFGNAVAGAGGGGGVGGAAPEPTTMALLMIGFLALAGHRRGR